MLLRVHLGSMAEVHLGTRSPFCLISLAGSFGASGRLGSVSAVSTCSLGCFTEATF